jgi:CubicO group peptidase (beta-lactamase class C family)
MVLRDALGRWRLEQRVPGAALVVADRTGRSTVIADGAADLEHGRSLRPEHRFEIGSIGKSFSAIAALRLAERGVLDLGRPVRHYLPWFRAGAYDRSITLHHLLCHSAGLPNGADFSDRSPFDAWILREGDTEPPGRYWYSNAGYKVLGLVLERITDRTCAEVVTDEVLRPLDMSESSAAVSHADRAVLATGYEPEPGTYPVPIAPIVPAPFIEVDTADGSVAATPADMGRYVAALLAAHEARGALLSSAGFDRLFGRHVRMTGRRWYGYGLGTDTVDGQRVFGHGGDMLGFRASLVGSRDAGLGAVLVSNQRRAGTPGLSRYALRVALADRAGRVPPEYAPPPIEDPGAWVGSYGGPSGTLEVEMRDGQPWATVDGVEVGLIAGEDGRFDLADPHAGRYPLRFSLTARGRVAVHGGRAFADPAPPSAHPQPSGSGRRARRLSGRFEAHNPWRRSVDVVVRGRALVLIEAEGEEEPLRPLGGDRFRVGPASSPERLAFDAVVDGRALRATASGHPYYRTGE